MKKFHLLYCLMLLAALASCSNSDFKIEGNLVNLKATQVRVVFRGDSGVVDGWTGVDKKGHFSFKGQAAQPVVVTLYGTSGTPLVNVVAVNGDHLKVKADMASAGTVKVKGNKLNEAWQLFRDEHADFYADANRSRLDAAIEKYVREHPDDMLSTVLLMVDYSDYSNRQKVQRLLNGINITARPQSLGPSILSQKGHQTPLPRLMSVTLMKHNGAFEEIDLTHRITLINFWANPQKNRSALLATLDNLDEGIRVLDVLAESDTLRWDKTIAADPTRWQHYWAPGGPLEPGVQLMGITSLPWYAVTDSTGMVTYSGPSIDSAINAATTALK